jgi:methyltransferase (TIGR00027 family)
VCFNMILWSYRLSVRTSGFHPEKRGSIPRSSSNSISKMPHKSIDNFPSISAATHFKLRGLHPLLDNGVIIFDDPVAVNLHSKLNSTSDYSLHFWKSIRSNGLFRSKITEYYLRESILAGTQQYVILGAGLDTFSIRRPNWAKNLDVYNVDFSNVLTARDQLLGNSGINVTSDINELTISTLEEYGFDRNKSSFFSMLGVSMYLDYTNQQRIYSEIASLNQVELVMTHLDVKATPTLQYITESSNEIGEPFIGKITEDDLIIMLNNAGFTTIIKPPMSIVNEWYKESLLPKPNLRSLTLAKKNVQSNQLIL